MLCALVLFALAVRAGSFARSLRRDWRALAGSGGAVGSMAPGSDKKTLAEKREAKAKQARENYLKAHGGVLKRYSVSRKGMGGPARATSIQN